MEQDLREFLKDMLGEAYDTVKSSFGQKKQRLEGYIQALEEVEEFLIDYE